MLFMTQIELKSDREEIVPVNSKEFPYMSVIAYPDGYAGGYIPWHWHSALEICYVENGEIEYHTSNGVCLLKKGDACFVNANTLHMIRAHHGMRGCRLYAQLFDMHFLSGIYNSIFEIKYFLPILKCQDIQVFPIRPDNSTGIRMITCLLNAYEVNEKTGTGYEFEVRNYLSTFWYMLFNVTEELRNNGHYKSDISIERIKLMINYIMNNYDQKVALDEIAKSANVSKRECLRCFKNNLGMSPIEYLNDYRIRMAAQMLAKSSDSVITVSENCGFCSCSYFSKVFRDVMGCTPKEYRKNTFGSS